MKRILLLAISMLIASRASAQTTWSEGTWYPDATGNVPAISEIPWTSLTHVDYVAPANPTTGGAISYPNGGPNVGDFSTNASALITAAHAHSVKVMFELTDSGNFDAAMVGSCAGPSAMKTFLNNIASVMSTYAFDGIFVDYEANTYNSQFGVFMGCLRAAYPSKLINWFAGVTYQIGQFGAGGSATCGPGSNWNVSTATIAAIAANADRVTLSAYDLGNPNNGFETFTYFNAALYSANFAMYGLTASVDWVVHVGTACGIAASKLSVSIPFYGDVYSINTIPYQAVNGSSVVNQYYYNVLPVSLSGSTQDSTAHVPWKTGGGGYQTWENAQSLTDKVNYVYSNNLGGWMLWTMGMDYFAGPSMPLLSAIGAAFMGGAPAITVQPTNKTVIVGGTATFSVTATGAATLTYQWKKNTVNIGGATSASYTTPAEILTDNGASFTVVVTNGIGNVTSTGAILTVNPAITPHQPVILGSLPSGTVGVPYSAKLTVTGDSPPDTWTVSPSVPSGLTMNPSTGLISGTPTVAASTPLSVTVTDGFVCSVFRRALHWFSATSGCTNVSAPYTTMLTINPATSSLTVACVNQLGKRVCTFTPVGMTGAIITVTGVSNGKGVASTGTLP